jgi:hypothetical protein
MTDLDCESMASSRVGLEEGWRIATIRMSFGNVLVTYDFPWDGMDGGWVDGRSCKSECT